MAYMCYCVLKFDVYSYYKFNGPPSISLFIITVCLCVLRVIFLLWVDLLPRPELESLNRYTPPSPPPPPNTHMHTNQLQPGVLELFQFLGERDIERALVTRNARLPTNAFLKRLDEELEANKDKYPSLKRDKLFSMVSVELLELQWNPFICR